MLPVFTAATWRLVNRPGLNGRLVVAKKVHHGGMLDKNRMRGRGKERDIQSCEGTTVGGNLARFWPGQDSCPRCPEGRGSWGWFSFPPSNGVINGLEREGTVRLLDICRETA